LSVARQVERRHALAVGVPVPCQKGNRPP
jgi:hypothetical protein